jgi:hypothetical protein
MGEGWQGGWVEDGMGCSWCRRTVYHALFSAPVVLTKSNQWSTCCPCPLPPATQPVVPCPPALCPLPLPPAHCPPPPPPLSCPCDSTRCAPCPPAPSVCAPPRCGWTCSGPARWQRATSCRPGQQQQQQVVVGQQVVVEQQLVVGQVEEVERAAQQQQQQAAPVAAATAGGVRWGVMRQPPPPPPPSSSSSRSSPGCHRPLPGCTRCCAACAPPRCWSWSPAHSTTSAAPGGLT